MRPTQTLFHFILVCFIFAGNGLNGQNSYYLQGHIPVIINGNKISNPWQGGLNSPQFANLDINNDGKQDMLVFDRNDFRVFPYLRGSDNVLTYAPRYERYIPPCKSFMRTADLNSDGKMDVFTIDGTNNFRIFKNITTTGDSFVKFKELGIPSDPPPNGFGHPLIVYRNRNPLDTSDPQLGLNILGMARTDLPSITDIDGDGDLDILAYDGFYNIYIEYRDVRVEKGWDKDTFEFQYMDACWGYYYDGFNGYPNLGVCPYKEKLQPRHAGGSTSLLFDDNRDGDLELVIGNVGQKHLYYTRNGRIDVGHNYDTLIAVDTIFPPNTNRATNFVFPGGHMADVDNDGIRDLLVSPNGLANVKETENVWYYRNVGLDDSCVFKYQQNDLFVNQVVDMGARTSPTFMDVDADGDKDMLLAGNGDFELTGGYKDRIWLFENQGNIKEPAFAQKNQNYLNLIKYGISEAKLNAADVDGDGDIDLLVGSGAGRLYYFENKAGKGNVVDLQFRDSTLLPNVGSNTWSAAPAVFNYDNDNLPDLLLGNYKGNVVLYKNTGSLGNPAYTLVDDSAWHMVGNEYRTDVTPAGFQPNGYAVPCVVNLDSSAAPEVLVGTVYGGLRFYKPEGRPVTDSLSALNNMLFQRSLTDTFDPDMGAFIAPAAADLDGDSIPEIIVGNARGGIMILTSKASKLNIGTKNIVRPEFRVFPNPAEKFIRIERSSSLGSYDVSVLDLVGREILRSRILAGESSLGLDVSGIRSGIYFVRLSHGAASRTEKVILR